jgi:hypothetical protein
MLNTEMEYGVRDDVQYTFLPSGEIVSQSGPMLPAGETKFGDDLSFEGNFAVN